MTDPDEAPRLPKDPAQAAPPEADDDREAIAAAFFGIDPNRIRSTF